MRGLVTAAGLLLAAASLPATAQMNHGAMDHGHGAHGAMNHEAAPPATDPHAGHDMHEQAPAADAAAERPNPHAGHAAPMAGAAIPQGVPPAVPTDHAADAFYDPSAMARARAAMLKESGGMVYSQMMLDRLEYRMGKGPDAYHWEGEGWIGGDLHRFAVKTEGEGEVGGRLERAEVQALYSRAINPWFNLEAGARQDFGRGPQRSYAVIGIDGLAPYWFEVSAQAFLSDKGDAHLRLEGSYDQRLTQRLILQPAAEVNIAAQDVPQLGIGSGIADIEMGLRLRYEVAREFAPYIGVNWERKLGDTADYARSAGERVTATSLVMGVRLWF